MMLPLLALALSICPEEVEAEKQVQARVDAACKTAPGCTAHYVASVDLPEDLELTLTRNALLQLPAEVLLAELRPLLHDPRPRVREEAIRALAFHPQPEALRLALDDVLAEAKLGSRTAIYALGSLRDERALPLLQQLIERGDCGPAPSRLWGLGDKGAAAYAAALRAPAVRPCAVGDAQLFMNDEYVRTIEPPLIEIANDHSRSAELRMAALVQLGTAAQLTHSPQAIRVMERALETKDVQLQRRAMANLIRLGRPFPSGRIAELLLPSEDWDEQQAGIQALIAAGPEGAAILRAELSSPDFGRRADAAEALGELRDRGSVAALSAVAADPRGCQAAQSAIRALVAIGDPSVVPALRKTSETYWLSSLRALAGQAADQLERHAGPLPPRPRPGGDLPEACSEGSFQGFRLPYRGATLKLERRVTSRPYPLPPRFPASALARLKMEEGEWLSFREVRGGWLVARDVGEFGGGLWFVSIEGAMRALATDWNNLAGFVETSAGLLVVGGLDHMSLTTGQVLGLSEGPGGAWTAKMLAELPASPRAWRRAPDGDLVLVTMLGAFAIGADGMPREISGPIKPICAPCGQR